LDTFHKQANPSRAAALFRQVLALNPDHDGATPQLARALDQGGKPEEALPDGHEMLEMAEVVGDAETIDTVCTRPRDAGQ
jgi:thioredoxin-like negative regulator of GroEL